jgi:short subunit dehydrogenase-like uncharacterized protein
MGARPARDVDIVVHGATGFAGRLLAEHLADHAPDGIRIAVSGRSAARLAAVRDVLGPRAADWPVLVVDAHDESALADLAARARVVATTVGPYARHGLPLVAACAAAGTDVVDLAGEVLFVRRSIDRHHATARASGARIVHACGWDSVPSDLSVLLAAERAHADGAGDLTSATLELVSASGGVSGGTVDSLRTQLAEMRADPEARRLAADPYALSPDRDAEPRLGRQPDAVGPRWDGELGAWTAPFAMAAYNTRIVRRSNALTGWSYGRRLRYREVTGLGRGVTAPLRAAGLTAGLGLLVGALWLQPTRRLMDRVLPTSGEGPDERRRREGHFRFRLHAATVAGARYAVTFAAQGDPGYAATAVMIGESALALVADRSRLPDHTGVLTPATGIGLPLVERLRVAGFEIAVARA